LKIYNKIKGKRCGLHQIIISSKFEPLESWLPSHYDSILHLNKRGTSSINQSASNLLSSLLSSDKKQQVLDKKSQNTSKNDQQEEQFDKYKDHILSDKSIADSVEAIIGAYLITSGPKATLHVMSWLGLEVLPKAKCEDGSEVLIDMPPMVPPLINDNHKFNQLIEGFHTFENCLGYKFKNSAYLLQAFTHASYTYNTITDCYQRLEFLGDAILDYVITRHLYEDKRYRHTPGQLTDLRSALVNNNIFAHLAVKFEFYKYFKYFSPALFAIIENYVKNQNDDFDLEEDFLDYPIDDDDYIDDLDESDGMEEDCHQNDNDSESDSSDLNSNSNYELEEMEVPKCLGDIFESVAGAIYLDSSCSFETVWRVYYSLMKPYIDKYLNQVPKSPIRELFELEPEAAKFEKPERTIDGKIRVTVCVFGRGTFKGIGRNYRIAKNAAAKIALKFLKKQ
jgi:endoribonuclease Dicer